MEKNIFFIFLCCFSSLYFCSLRYIHNDQPHDESYCLMSSFKRWTPGQSVSQITHETCTGTDLLLTSVRQMAWLRAETAHEMWLLSHRQIGKKKAPSVWLRPRNVNKQNGCSSLVFTCSFACQSLRISEAVMKLSPANMQSMTQTRWNLFLS